MNERDINKRLLKHAIDFPGQPLPSDLAKIVVTNEKANQEWKRLQGWLHLLQDEEPWQPPEGFYKKLAAQAFYEKRRAELTASTSRDLQLDDHEETWRPSLSPWFAKSVLIGLFFLMIGLPTVMMVFNQWNSIGQFEYVEGGVLVQADRDNKVDYNDHIRRGAVIVTPANSNCILKLEGGANLVVAALSRINVNDHRNIKVERGRVYFDIIPGQGDFNIQVPDGFVHVVGTAFEVQVDTDKTSVLVTEGTVLLNDGNAKESLSAGHLGELSPSQPITIKPSPNAHQKINWVRTLQDKKNKHDIQRYYPSLARPNQLTGE